MSSSSTQPPRRRPPSVIPRPRNVAGRTQGRLRLTSPTPAPRSWWRRTTRRIRRFTGTVFTAGVWSRIGRLTTWIGAVGVAVAAFTGLIFSYQQNRLTEQGQITERFSKAVEQLASTELDVRLGGIYSLERLARDSKADYPTIMEVLGAYVRGHAPAPQVDIDRSAPEPVPVPVPVRCGGNEHSDVPIDIQAIVTVIGRRDPEAVEDNPIDMSKSCLVGSSLYDGAQLRAVNLAGTDLRKASLEYVDLREALLIFANLSGGRLASANLSGATVSLATLTSVDLDSADLSDTNFFHSDLAGADLTRANLSGARLWYARLYGADLTDATLTGASLDGIRYDSSTKWPNGFTPPPSS